MPSRGRWRLLKVDEDLSHSPRPGVAGVPPLECRGTGAARHGAGCSQHPLNERKHIMKRSLIIALALTLGSSALTVLAQPQDESSRRQAGPPQSREDARLERENRRAEAAQARRENAPRMQRPDAAGPRQMWRSPGQFGGPQQRFTPGRQGFGPQRGGPAWNMPRERGGAPEFCPHCQRPFLRDAIRERFGRGGFGPQNRGPAFGPPPWAGRGGPGADLQSGPRGPRPNAPWMQDRRDAPRRAPEGRFERPGPGPRPEGRGPANRPPMDRNNR